MTKKTRDLTPEFMWAYGVQHEAGPDLSGLRPLSSIARMTDAQFEEFLVVLRDISDYMPLNRVKSDWGDIETSEERYERLKARAVAFRARVDRMLSDE